MKSSSLRWSLRIVTTLALVACWSAFVSAQDEDIDPNSPTPILISEPDSTRALAAPYGVKLMKLEQFRGQAYPTNSRVVLFATNLDLADGEGASALRLAVQDAQGRLFRFPVVELSLYRGTPGPSAIYTVTVEVSDSFHFWDFDGVDGDTLIGLTWRGLMSNRTRLGVNHTGGGIKDDAGAAPTPLDSIVKVRARQASTSKAGRQETVGYKWSGDRRRFLEQATFGPTQALDDRIRRIGLKTWLAEQLDSTLPYPSTNNPYPNNPLKPGAGLDPTCDNNTTVPDVPLTCFRDTYSMYQPQTWFMREAYYGDAQLRHRMAFALSEIWVTSGVDITQGRHEVEYWKVLAEHAFGNYRDLMKEMTLHHTMGDYLSMALSTRLAPN